MIYSDDAFVLKKTDLLNEDKIVQLFCREKGKISCIAKGVKKTTSRKAGNLELLNLCRVSLATGKNFDVLTESKLIEDYDILRASEIGLFFLFYIDEVVTKMLYDGEISIEIFEMLEEVLTYCKSDPDQSKKKILCYVNAKLLLYSGVFPETYQCVECGNVLIETDDKVLTPTGIAHKECIIGEIINNNSVKILRFLHDHTLAEFEHIRTGESLDNTVYSLTIHMIEYTIGSAIRSKMYINGAK